MVVKVAPAGDDATTNNLNTDSGAIVQQPGIDHRPVNQTLPTYPRSTEMGHEISVLIVSSNNESSSNSAHLRRLARAFAAHIHKVLM